MDLVLNGLIILGLTSLMLLWIFCIGGMLNIFWDTLSDPIQALIKRFKK